MSDEKAVNVMVADMDSDVPMDEETPNTVVVESLSALTCEKNKMSRFDELNYIIEQLEADLENADTEDEHDAIQLDLAQTRVQLAKEVDKMASPDEEEDVCSNCGFVECECCGECGALDCDCEEDEEYDAEEEGDKQAVSLGLVFENQISRIQYWELKQDFFDASIRGVRTYHDDTNFNSACNIIRSRFHEEIMNAYKDMFMIATMGPSHKQVQKAREIAQKKFFREHYGLAHLLNKTGEYLGQVSRGDEESLRRIVKEVVEEGKEEE